MTTVEFQNLTIDQALESLESKIAKLSRPQVAAFFAIAGEALLSLYARFSLKTGWGDATVLKSAIAAVLQTATGMSNLTARRTELMSAVSHVTPGDEFDTPDSTFAQDAAICVDAAIRAATGDEPVNPEWIWYALEPAVQSVCLEETGYLDHGTTSRVKKWKAEALRRPTLRKAFESLAEMADHLTGTGGTVSPSDLETLRRLSSRLVPVQKS